LVRRYQKAFSRSNNQRVCGVLDVIAQAGHQRADAVTDLALPARTNFMPRLRRAVNGYEYCVVVRFGRGAKE
jgi:hypothetical protein